MARSAWRRWLRAKRFPGRAAMEPRRVHLGGASAASSVACVRQASSPQWSPGEFAWETTYAGVTNEHANAPQRSPGEFTWETCR